jgi:hypothetical protein
MAVVTQIQVRRGTASQWTSTNPTLASGEFGYETDTGKAKIGNGSTAWNSLAYAITGTDGDITGVTAGTGLSGGGTSGTVTVSIDTAVTADLTTAQTLINKTLTTPVISSISNSGTVTVPTGTVTLATLTSTETFTNKTLTDAKINLGIDPETASYTAVLANNSQIVTMNNASANTFSIPTDASVDFPVGTQITVLQIGAGQTTIQAVTAGTTTINSTGGTANAPKLRVRYSSATCIKLSANNWVVIGDIS